MLSRHQIWLSKAALGLALAALFVQASGAADPETPTSDNPEVVVSVNIRQILGSGLAKKYALDPIKNVLQSDQNAQKVITATGLDPLKDLDSITVSGANLKPPQALIVVRGRFDAEKINAAMADQAKKEKTLKSSKEGALTVWQAEKDGQTLFATVASKGTMLMSLDKDNLVKAATGVGTGKIGGELKTAIGKLTGKESMWLASIVTEEMKTKLGENPQTKKYADKLKAITGSITFTDDIQFGAQIYTTQADIAKEIRKVLNDLKPFLNLLASGNEQAAPIAKELLDALKIETKDTTVTIDLKVSEDLIKKIQAMGKQ
jgi:hypothetical protein